MYRIESAKTEQCIMATKIATNLWHSEKHCEDDEQSIKRTENV